MKKILFTITVLASCMNYTIAQQMNTADMAFATEAAAAGMMEVKLGELAVSKAKSADVKTLGQHMITDHTKANEELKALAASKKMTLPAKMNSEGQKNFDDLSKKEGAEFDKAYSELMVKDHKKVIAKFQAEADKGTDADLKSWASKTLPTLQHHLTMSEQTASKIKK